MREISATEAARRFAHVLDQAEAGEEFVITRKGVCIARLVPAAGANGGEFVRLAATWAGHIGLDDDFEAAVAAIDEFAVNDDSPWPS